MSASDENLLDQVGTGVILVALLAIVAVALRGGPVVEVLKVSKPLILGGLAAIAGVSVLAKFFKSR